MILDLVIDFKWLQEKTEKLNAEETEKRFPHSFARATPDTPLFDMALCFLT